MLQNSFSASNIPAYKLIILPEEMHEWLLRKCLLKIVENNNAS